MIWKTIFASVVVTAYQLLVENWLEQKHYITLPMDTCFN